jgi:hypothetical protein
VLGLVIVVHTWLIIEQRLLFVLTIVSLLIVRVLIVLCSLRHGLLSLLS